MFRKVISFIYKKIYFGDRVPLNSAVKVMAKGKFKGSFLRVLVGHTSSDYKKQLPLTLIFTTKFDNLINYAPYKVLLNI